MCEVVKSLDYSKDFNIVIYSIFLVQLEFCVMYELLVTALLLATW